MRGRDQVVRRGKGMFLSFRPLTRSSHETPQDHRGARARIAPRRSRREPGPANFEVHPDRRLEAERQLAGERPARRQGSDAEEGRNDRDLHPAYRQDGLRQYRQRACARQRIAGKERHHQSHARAARGSGDGDPAHARRRQGLGPDRRRQRLQARRGQACRACRARGPGGAPEQAGKTGEAGAPGTPGAPPGPCSH